MNGQGIKKSPWRDILAEVTVQQNLIESLLHAAPESRESRRDLSIGFSAASPNICTPNCSRRRASVRSTGARAIISPSPEPQGTRDLRGNCSPSANVDQSGFANQVGASTGSHSQLIAIETSKVVEALVEALSTSSWSSDADISATQLGPGCTLARDAAASSSKMHSRSESPRGAIASDVGQRHRETVGTAQFFLKASHIVADEFEGRQSIVFGEFTEVTELVSQFVCRVTMTSPPL